MYNSAEFLLAHKIWHMWEKVNLHTWTLLINSHLRTEQEPENGTRVTTRQQKAPWVRKTLRTSLEKSISTYLHFQIQSWKQLYSLQEQTLICSDQSCIHSGWKGRRGSQGASGIWGESPTALLHPRKDSLDAPLYLYPPWTSSQKNLMRTQMCTISQSSPTPAKAGTTLLYPLNTY